MSRQCQWLALLSGLFLAALLTGLWLAEGARADGPRPEGQPGKPRPAYPPSPVIQGIEWAPADTILRQARDGDNWPVTWADDDALYTTWGDGTGFPPKVAKKLSCGFARVTGPPGDFTGTNVRSPAEQLGEGRKGKKGWGILSVGGTLYLWMGHADREGAAAQLAWSRDRARTWTFADWRFAEFGLVGFVNYGKDYHGARDDFVYAYSHDGPRADTPADHFVLLRAPKDRLTRRAAWEFLERFDKAGRPVWTADVRRRGAVFTNTGACLRSAMTYNAGLRRYLWWQQLPQPEGHRDRGDTRFAGGFAVYDAPEPWGPWTTAYFTPQWDVGPGEHGDFPSKWMSEDGRAVHLVFSGEDSFSVRRATVRVVGVPAGQPERPRHAVPYPMSNTIPGVKFEPSTRKTLARGSDIWPITWADDDHQYAAFGDGAGFGVTSAREQSGPSRVSLGVARVEGRADSYRGINVWGGKDAENPATFTGKGTGLLCVGGVLYLWVAGPGSMCVPETRLAVSRDHARTWKLADWKWTMGDRLFAGVFLNFGRDYAGARDDYVYAYFTRIENPPPQDKPRNWIHEVPGRVDLARVPKGRILDEKAYEWFAGRDGLGGAAWTRKMAARTAVFEDPSGIRVVSVCYQPRLRKYLLAYNPRDNRGNFGLFEAAEPWGPWHTVSYLRGYGPFMPPEENKRVSVFHLPPKWWGEDGRTFTLLFNPGDDAWNTMRGRLLLPESEVGGRDRSKPCD